MAILPGLDSMLNCHCNLSTSQTQHHLQGVRDSTGGSSELGFGTKCSHGSMKSRSVHQASVSRLEFQGWGFGKFDALPCQQCRRLVRLSLIDPASTDPVPFTMHYCWVSMFRCISVYICIYIYIYIYIYICVCVYVMYVLNIYIYICVCVSMCVSVFLI